MTQEAKYAPGFLISVPQLLDPNFYHAVVLLIEHTSEGAMGLTINHPTDKSIQSLYEQMGRPWPGDDQPLLMRGGPATRTCVDSARSGIKPRLGIRGHG